MSEHWRWNSNITWHYFSSMYYETHCAANANNDFTKYHHRRSALYYAVGTIESYLNSERRKFLEAANTDENKIQKELKDTRLPEKRKKWPEEMYGANFHLDDSITQIFEKYSKDRNEITHPKNRDHSIYAELDNMDDIALRESVAKSLVSLHSAKNTPFPYWALGWNYVGMNGNPAYPFEGNIHNGFLPSLQAMGYRVPSADYGSANVWVETNMTSLVGYDNLKKILDNYPNDIEPYWDRFPMKPRLCRRWWDHQFINSTIPSKSPV